MHFYIAVTCLLNPSWEKRQKRKTPQNRDAFTGELLYDPPDLLYDTVYCPFRQESVPECHKVRVTIYMFSVDINCHPFLQHLYTLHIPQNQLVIRQHFRPRSRKEFTAVTIFMGSKYSLFRSSIPTITMNKL